MSSGDFPYERTDYDGEVYRMDINCSNTAIDCVYFKLNGTTDLTEGKFNYNIAIVYHMQSYYYDNYYSKV